VETSREVSGRKVSIRNTKPSVERTLKGQLVPILTVVAGPNGSGKSTLTRIAREAFQDLPILDPDAIAKKIQKTSVNGGSAIDAGRAVLEQAAELIRHQQSFLVETTLSGNTYLRMMREAKLAGYRTSLFFVGTADIEINLKRVAERVAEGGHDVPEEDQRRRYPRSMANMRKAFELADEAVLFDNSGRAHLRLALKDDAGLTIYQTLPSWAAFLRPN
jgi:predicted ABC-type ATPase